MRFVGLVCVAVLAAACHPPAPLPPEADLDVATTPAARWYTLTWQGAQVGWAVERERHDDHGVTLVREEELRLRRGDALVVDALRIEVRATRELVATDVFVSHPTGDAAPRVQHAHRDATGWTLDGAATSWPRDAVPTELVPLLVRRDGTFSGAVVMPGRGFAVGTATVTGAGAQRLAHTVIDGAPLDTVIELDAVGDALTLVDSTGVAAQRSDARAASAAFTPTDVVGLGTLAVEGTPGHDFLVRVTTSLGDHEPPGQRSTLVLDDPLGDAFEVALGTDLPGSLAPGAPGTDRTAEIAAATRAVFDELEPSLAVPTATSGDCTTYALALHARLVAADVPAQLVTGYRLVDGAFVRHRWVVAWTGARWVAADATVGEAPAQPMLWGLAVHDATTAAIIGAELAYGGLHGAYWRY